MLVHWWNYMVEAGYFFGHLTVAILLWRKQRIRQWPFFFSYCAATAALTLIMFLVQGHPKWIALHFYAHWSGEVTIALLGFGVLYDTVRAIPLVRHLPISLRYVFGTAAITLAVSVTIVACMESPGATNTFVNVALLLRRTIAITWAVFGLSLFLSVSALGMAWTPEPLRIGKGFMLQLMPKLLLSYLGSITLNQHRAVAIFFAEDALCLLCLPYWIYALTAQPDTESLTDPEDTPSPSPRESLISLQ